MIVVLSTLVIALGEFQLEKSVLVISENLRPFVNTLAPDEKYFPGKSENQLRQPIEIQLSAKLKSFPANSTAFHKSTFDFKDSERNDESHSLMPLRTYRLRNTCLCKCLKKHVYVHPRTVNMLKGAKQHCNLHDSSFISFVHHYGKISVGKIFLSNMRNLKTVC